MSAATLFLDFDGVLHPSAAYRQTGGGIMLLADGHELFEYAGILCEILAPYPDLRIVLSTSWVSALGSFDRAKGYLPATLQAQIVGATWHSHSLVSSAWGGGCEDRYEWHGLTRYEQIRQYAVKRRLLRWLAIDDDDIGWPADQRDKLVCTHEWHGLGDELARSDLREKLKIMMG